MSEMFSSFRMSRIDSKEEPSISPVALIESKKAVILLITHSIRLVLPLKRYLLTKHLLLK
jgi:hypothetical protein